MTSWKDNNLLRKHESVYRPTMMDRNELMMNARDLGNMLKNLADIAVGKSDKNFDETKQEFEEVLSMFYSMLDDVRM